MILGVNIAKQNQNKIKLKTKIKQESKIKANTSVKFTGRIVLNKKGGVLCWILCLFLLNLHLFLIFIKFFI